MPKFVPRQRKHKVLARQKNLSSQEPEHGDSNAVELVPASKAEKEERRSRLREELRAQQPNITGKKKKRLDKYIETKLRKEENLDLLKKLANTKIDTSLFRSSRELGAANGLRRKALPHANGKHGSEINVEENEDHVSEFSDSPTGLDSDSDSLSEASEADLALSKVLERDFAEQGEPENRAPRPVTFGSGLKRPLQIDADGHPVIRKRQRVVSTTGLSTIISYSKDDTDDTTSAWEGFSDPETLQDDRDESHSSDSNSLQGSEPVSSDEDGSSEESDMAEKISHFKAWANQHRNAAIGFVPSADSNVHPPDPAVTMQYTPRPVEVDPLPPELEVPAENSTRTAYSVHIERPKDVQEARLALPVVAEEQKIMEAIHNNDIVVISGATGSGKTTQVPQFLFEAGYGDKNGSTPGRIGVTQPRRVAAFGMAERVGYELGPLKDKVGYQVRFDSSTVNEDTAIKFMTDGILLRELSQDISLSKYSAIIIDEAHERTVDTDLLIGLLSRIVPNIRGQNARRGPPSKPLKLIIMSATLRTDEFLNNQRLFPKGPPPLVQVEGRQYPVTTHFARKTYGDYVEEAFKKVNRGHRKLPPGGMLVFLTGENEVWTLARRLKKDFVTSEESMIRPTTSTASTVDAPLETEDRIIEAAQRDDEDAREEFIDADDSDKEFDEEEQEEQDFEIGQTADEMQQTSKLKLHILPLFSKLEPKDQLRVFDPPPEGSRLIVLATNVAETSLTIPGIRYVFDCGRAKKKKLDLRTGVQSFEIDWISKASASQRAGRAGRTGPGHCYRLYSSPLYESYFAENTEPEILSTPIDGVVLRLRNILLSRDINFPFPTQPSSQSLEKAERLLQYLGAISRDGEITLLGQKMSKFPLGPRLAKIFVQGQENGPLVFAATLAAALNVPEVFVPEDQLAHNTETHGITEDEVSARESRKKAYNAAHRQLSKLDKYSDAIKIFNALFVHSGKASTKPDNRHALEDYCQNNILREKAMNEAAQLRQQLIMIAEPRRSSRDSNPPDEIPNTTVEDVRLLKTIVAAGFVDQVAIRADHAPVPPAIGKPPSRAINVPYITRFPSHSPDDTGLVYLHPTSVLASLTQSKLPDYIIYSRLQRSATGVVRMHPLTPVGASQLAILAKDTPLLEMGKPVGKVTVVGVDERVCNCGVSLVGEKGCTPWPLAVWKVRQKRIAARGWVVQEVLD